MSDFPSVPGGQPPSNQPQQPNGQSYPAGQPSGYPQQGYPQTGYPQQPQSPYQQASYQGNYQSVGYPQGLPPKPSNTLGIIALVLGIVAIFLAWLPFVGLISIPLGLAAAICGGIALARKGANKVMPAIGGSLGVISIVAAIVITVITVTAISNVVQDSASKLPSGFPTSIPTELNKEHSFKLVVSSEVDAELSYSAGGQSASGVAVKGAWEKAIAGKTVLGLATITVTSKDIGSGGKISCEIFIDGTSVDKKSGTGFVGCVGTLK